jgi:hypothetical protein
MGSSHRFRGPISSALENFSAHPSPNLEDYRFKRDCKILHNDLYRGKRGKRGKRVNRVENVQNVEAAWKTCGGARVARVDRVKRVKRVKRVARPRFGGHKS